MANEGNTSDLIGETTKTNPETGEEEVIPDILELHKSLPTQIAIEGAHELYLFPRTSIEKEGNIQFKIATGSDEFLDPFDMYLFCVTRILKPDGTNLTKGHLAADGKREGAGYVTTVDRAKVMLVNGINSAWFKNINVRLNGEVIASGDNMYMYKADLENKLSYPKDVKEGILNVSGFQEEEIAFDDLEANIPDTFWTEPNVYDPLNRNKMNLVKRLLKSEGSKHVYTMGRLHSELFDQPKLLPPNTVLDIELDRNSNDFLKLTQKDHEHYVKLDQCYLLARIARVNTEVTNDIEHMTFKGKSLMYPIRRVEMSYYSKGPNTNDLSKTDIFNNKVLPRRVFITMVRQTAFSGAGNQDPFNYQHFNLRRIALRTGGRIEPLPPLECDFTRNDWLKPLYALRSATGSFLNDAEIGIDYDNFAKRNVIVGWDLTGSRIRAGEAFEMIKNKTVDLEIKLNEPLDDFVVNVIIYAEFDSEIEINENRDVQLRPYA